MALRSSTSGANQESLRKSYVTYRFERHSGPDGKPERMYTQKSLDEHSKDSSVPLKEVYAAALAHQAGFYFEACLYQALCKQTKSKYSNADLNGSQKQAIYLFRQARVDPKLSPAKKSGVRKAVEKLRQTVEDSANLAAIEISRYFTEELQKAADNTDITIPVSIGRVKNIAVSDSGGGNIMGDLEVVVNGHKHILELKWQMAAFENSARATRYFGPVSDATLFGGGFAGWVRAHKDKYWANELPEPVWKEVLATEGLKGFLNSLGMSNQELVKYLLAKGNVPLGSAEKELDAFLATKSVVHANFTGITIQGLPELAETIYGAASDQRGFGRLISDHQDGLLLQTEDGQGVMSFYLSKFLNQRIKSNSSAPEPYAFSFSMYIAQKYMGMLR